MAKPFFPNLLCHKRKYDRTKESMELIMAFFHFSNLQLLQYDCQTEACLLDMSCVSYVETYMKI